MPLNLSEFYDSHIKNYRAIKDTVEQNLVKIGEHMASSPDQNPSWNRTRENLIKQLDNLNDKIEKAENKLKGI